MFKPMNDCPAGNLTVLTGGGRGGGRGAYFWNFYYVNLIRLIFPFEKRAGHDPNPL